MQRNSKIFTIIIFILLLIVIFSKITISIAVNDDASVDFSAERYKVTGETTPEEMIQALQEGKTLTGISAKIKDQNDNILCRERHWAIYRTGVYQLKKGEEYPWENKFKEEYPGKDKNENGKIDDDELEKHGHAKAYILAAPGYVKNDDKYGDVTKADERQYAWYFIMGQTDGKTGNDLYNIAIAYENYKLTQEIPAMVTGDELANTEVIGEQLVHGPIQVEYSYAKAESGSKFDEWGGFRYAFFDGDDENATNISDKVKLCTLENDQYIPINSTLITSEDDSNGYYQVQETTYNKMDLYVVTSEKNISNVRFKIKDNQVDYTAKLFALKGEHHRTTTGQVLCSACDALAENATTSMEEAAKEVGNVLEVNGHYYQYKGAQSEVVYRDVGEVAPANVYRVDGTDYPVKKGPFPTYVNANKCDYCGNNGCNIGHYETAGDPYTCPNCNRIFSDATTAINHFKASHKTTRTKCEGCDEYGCTSSHLTRQGLGYVCPVCVVKLFDKKADALNHFNENHKIKVTVCDYCEKEGCNVGHYTGSGQRYFCPICAGRGFLNALDATNHFLENHKTTVLKYTRTVHVFELLGCGRDMGEKTSDCGYPLEPGYYNSQGLHIIVAKEDKKSNEIKLDIEIEFATSVKVEKKWLDCDNKYQKRPDSITVKLLANGKDTGKTLELKEENNWKGRFEDLETNDVNGTEIKYTVGEDEVPGYEPKIVQDEDGFSFVITNTLEMDYLKVVKIWNDANDFDEYRPPSITVDLLADDKPIERVILNEANKWEHTFEKLKVCDENGKEIEYTVKENVIEHYSSDYPYRKAIDANGNIVYYMTNSHITTDEGYIEINGNVWKDRPDGKGNDINGIKEDDENGIEGIKVTLKDKDGNIFDQTSFAETDSNGNYTIKVNYDNTYKTADGKNVYKLYEDIAIISEKLKTAYIEFEYDAMKYTTVAKASTGENTSKAIEDETTRNNFDSAHTTVTSTTAHPDEWEDNAITAITKDVISFETYQDKSTISREEIIKYCNGNGTSVRTNRTHTWHDLETETCKDCPKTAHTSITKNIRIQTINNVNLGLFEREQPDVCIDIDVGKVDVIVRNQQYTYIYNERTEVAEAKAKEAYEKAYQYAISQGMSEEEAIQYAKQEEIQVKFQNEGTYTYRRPINPADIAYLNDGGEALSVFVTYKIRAGNKSATLPITIYNIINCYENEYEIKSIKMGDRTIKYKTQEIAEKCYYPAGQNKQAKETILEELNIQVAPQSESEVIEITYEVSLEAIKGLLQEDALLNNAVEIESYSTKYGEKTLYAEQRTGGRTNESYGGYDYNSHPGNAGYIINSENRLEATKLEDDNKEAPSFVLCKDEESKVISGTVWEDSSSINTDRFRLGNGKNENEKGIENVKVELWKVNADESTVQAYLYNSEGEKVLAEAKTDSNGNYSFGTIDGYGVVTDRYRIKFIYGEESNKNARNYKSTIISQENINVYDLFKETNIDDEWHLNASDNYSIAVDDIQERINIENLKYGNFDNQINMTAYSKPFELQVEFDPSATKESKVISDGKTLFGNELNIFDFGIVERAREDIFVETTVEYISVTLASGQILIEGNPNEKELNYAKAIGFGRKIENGTVARNAMAKQITMEIDSGLIQGAQLNAKYAVKVTNKSEKEYDYYVNGQEKTEYYYFGTNNEGSPVTIGSIELLATYIDAELVDCVWENSSDWTEIKDAETLKRDDLISDETKKSIDNGKYKIFTTTKFSELKTDETATEYVTATKLLSNKDEIAYDNHVEILEIDAKTARTIKETDVIKEYKMGNYVASLEPRKINNDINKEIAGLHEQDDDRIKIVITPPTGATENIIIYAIITLIVLMVIAVRITYIKRKRKRK